MENLLVGNLVRVIGFEWSIFHCLFNSSFTPSFLTKTAIPINISLDKIMRVTVCSNLVFRCCQILDVTF